MSGYGAYVWSCYGLTAVVLLWNAISAQRALREQVLHAKRRAEIQAAENPS